MIKNFDFQSSCLRISNFSKYNICVKPSAILLICTHLQHRLNISFKGSRKPEIVKNIASCYSNFLIITMMYIKVYISGMEMSQRVRFWNQILPKIVVFWGNGKKSHFVSPELSSGRDLVIQMSVRRAPSAVRRPPSMVFCPEHISGTVWPTLMIFGMWVGLGLKLRMLNFGRGRCLLST